MELQDDILRLTVPGLGMVQGHQADRVGGVGILIGRV
jgi:hypothetical protein